ncbi:MAG: ABC transporter permease subunit, partial [Gammaproteobacteria bacterium]|nr:ABC transporter permease subunit [Gammaproteobacteria bacterium]
MVEERRPGEAPSNAALWRRPVFRSTVFQVLLVLGVVYLGNSLLSNTLYNLEQRGISTGFDFLSNAAGFGIVQSLIDYQETDTFARTFLVGLVNTILVSTLGIFFATVIGFVVGVARLSKNWLIAKLAMVYIETFRNIP